jgi:hypothetical protein
VSIFTKADQPEEKPRKKPKSGRIIRLVVAVLGDLRIDDRPDRIFPVSIFQREIAVFVLDFSSLRPSGEAKPFPACRTSRRIKPTLPWNAQPI